MKRSPQGISIGSPPRVRPCTWLGCTANKFTAAPTPFTFSNVQSFSWPSPDDKIYGFDPNYKTAYNYQWNVSVEREMLKGLTLMVGYLGNRGRNLTAREDINYPNYSADAGWGNIQARRPNQGYGSIYIATSKGKSSYNALQMATPIPIWSTSRTTPTTTR